MSTADNQDQTTRERVLYDELFKHPTNEFKKHLELEGNHRILFSGMYGVGKTTFIDHFFDPESQIKNFNADKYKVIHLYPVNYTISTTEDIFKYIKVDILFELLTKYNDEIDFNENELSTSTIAAFYIASKFNNIAWPLLMMLGQLNTSAFPAEEVITACNTLKTLSDKIVDEIDKTQGDSHNLKQVAKFIKPELEREGSPYEQNLITNLIIDYTAQLRKGGKEIILIVDDLDRLDPSHIFRLFNIFAAHFDQKQETQNKFGFDKVIFVCDITNIRRLYAHFNGGSSSFSGYIDKFYSRRIFRYDNAESVIQMTRTLVEDSQFYYEPHGQKERIWDHLLIVNLSNILKTFLTNGSTSLRSLLKLKLPIKVSYKDLNLGLPFSNVNINVSAAVELEVLINILGSKEDVIDAFSLAKESSNLAFIKNAHDPIYRNFAASCLPIIGTGEGRYRRYYSREDVYIQMELNAINSSGEISIVSKSGEITHPLGTQLDTDAADFYIQALNYLIQRNFL